jgi:hypothetical protein
LSKFEEDVDGRDKPGHDSGWGIVKKPVVIASDSEAIQTSIAATVWIASSRSLRSVAHSPDPLPSRNDVIR